MSPEQPDDPGRRNFLKIVGAGAVTEAISIPLMAWLNHNLQVGKELAIQQRIPERIKRAKDTLTRIGLSTLPGPLDYWQSQLELYDRYNPLSLTLMSLIPLANVVVCTDIAANLGIPPKSGEVLEQELARAEKTQIKHKVPEDIDPALQRLLNKRADSLKQLSRILFGPYAPFLLSEIEFVNGEKGNAGADIGAGDHKMRFFLEGPGFCTLPATFGPLVHELNHSYLLLNMPIRKMLLDGNLSNFPPDIYSAVVEKLPAILAEFDRNPDTLYLPYGNDIVGERIIVKLRKTIVSLRPDEFGGSDAYSKAKNLFPFFFEPINSTNTNSEGSEPQELYQFFQIYRNNHIDFSGSQFAQIVEKELYWVIEENIANAAMLKLNGSLPAESPRGELVQEIWQLLSHKPNFNTNELIHAARLMLIRDMADTAKFLREGPLSNWITEGHLVNRMLEIFTGKENRPDEKYKFVVSGLPPGTDGKYGLQLMFTWIGNRDFLGQLAHLPEFDLCMEALLGIDVWRNIREDPDFHLPKKPEKFVSSPIPVRNA